MSGDVEMVEGCLRRLFDALVGVSALYNQSRGGIDNGYHLSYFDDKKFGGHHLSLL